MNNLRKIIGIVTLIMVPLYIAGLVVGVLGQTIDPSEWVWVNMVILATAGTTAMVCCETLPGTVTAMILYVIFAFVEPYVMGSGGIDSWTVMAIGVVILMAISTLVSIRVSNSAPLPEEDDWPPKEPDEK